MRTRFTSALAAAALAAVFVAACSEITTDPVPLGPGEVVLYTSEAGIVPYVISGGQNTDKTCVAVFGPLEGLEELKQEPFNASGNLNDGTLFVSWVKPSTLTPANPNTFDWTSNIPVLGVIVKDGDDGANVYDYGNPGSTGDRRLSTPFEGGKGISHVSWCYVEQPVVELQDLVVEKTAAGTYDRTVEWTLVKKVREATDPFSTGVDLLELSGVPGQEFDIVWDVIVTKTEEEDNFEVTGTITIKNPNPVPVDVAVTDTLDDGTIADVDCDPETVGDQPYGTVPAHDGTDDGVLVCSYTASPDGRDAEVNRADVEVTDYDPPANAIGTIEGGFATDDIDWTENLIGFDEGVLTDDRFPEDEETLDASENVEFPETFECPTDVEEYENGICIKTFENTAYLTFEDDSVLEDSATVEITCSGLYGCTPGFWKVEVHWGHWGPTGYLPTDLVNSVFDPSPSSFANGIGTATLVEALDFGGGAGVAGGQRILLRAAVASLLNFAHPDVNFGIPDLPGITDAASLIAAVNAALATGDRATMIALAEILDDANNAVNLCALDGRSFLD
jgi:hypothetical protein